MHNKTEKINYLEKENEKLKKTTSDKYFENRIIDTELDFINNLQNMKVTNNIIAVSICLISFLCAFLCINKNINLLNIKDVLMLSINTGVSLLIGSKLGNYVNNKLLKELELDRITVNKKEEDLINKKEENIKIININNKKLMNNNSLIENLYEEINNINNNKYIDRKYNEKNKVLALKKII